MKQAAAYKQPLHQLLIRWLRSRMLLWKIAALWTLILLAVLLAAPDLWHGLNNPILSAATIRNVTYITVLTLLLITAFRLWDDVADIAHDRQQHAERVLVTSTINHTVLHAVIALLLLLASLMLYGVYSWLAVLALLLLTLLMLLIYQALPALTPQRELRDTLVLLKYPAMLIILTGGQPNLDQFTIAVTLYGLLVIYESYSA